MSLSKWGWWSAAGVLIVGALLSINYHLSSPDFSSFPLTVTSVAISSPVLTLSADILDTEYLSPIASESVRLYDGALLNMSGYVTGTSNVQLFRLIATDDLDRLSLQRTGDRPSFTVLNGVRFSNLSDRILFDADRVTILWHRSHEITIGGSMYYASSGDIMSFHQTQHYDPVRSIGNQAASIDRSDDVRGQTSASGTRTIILKDSIATSGTIAIGLRERKNLTVRDVQLDGQSQSFVMSGSTFVVPLRLLSDTRHTLQRTVYENSLPYTYIVEFKTFGRFQQTTSKNYPIHPQGTGYGLNQHLCFSQPLDEDQVRTKLTQALGTGAITLVMSHDDLTYDDRDQRNYCIMYYYYLDPRVDHNYTVTGLQSIFGETLTINISIPAHTLSPEHQFATIVGNTINVLPLYGYQSQQLQLNYKNTPLVDVFARNCRRATGATGRQSLMDRIMIGTTGDTTYEILEYLTVCESESRSISVRFPNFKYWKNTLTTVDMKSLVAPTISIYKAGLTNNPRTQKFFLRTDIGSLVKQFEGTLHLWTNSFRSGKPLPVVYEMVIFSGTQVDVMTGTTTGYTSIVVPRWGENHYGYLLLRHEGDQTIVPITNTPWSSLPSTQRDSYGNPINTSTTNAFYMFPDSTLGCSNCGYASYESPFRIFAYTDRVLYKPGDMIHIAGWIRKPGSAKLPSQPVTVTISNVDDGVSQYNATIDTLDAFGGFVSDFQTSPSIKLGTYSISITYIDTNGKQSYYNQYIKLQEYKKKSFGVTTTLTTQTNGQTLLSVAPKYYFGGDLTSYNLSANYTMVGENYGLYDWSRCGQERCDEPMIRNRIRGTNLSTGGNLTLTGLTQHRYDVVLPTDVPFVSNLNLDIVTTDASSKEIVYSTLYETLYPKYLVGLQGRDYTRTNAKKPYILKGKIQLFDTNRGDRTKNYKATSTSLQVITYYKSYEVVEEMGPDEEYYYADQQYRKIHTTTLSTNSDGTFSYQPTLSTGGTYFFRVMVDGRYEAQQTLNLYDDATDRGRYGQINNSWKLTLYAKDKEYQPGDLATINIEPYIKGAHTIVTVEKDNTILYHQSLVLSGNTIQIPVAESRYPNAMVSVAMIAGEELNRGLSDYRREPRFWIGYTNIKLDPTLVRLQTSLLLIDSSGKTITKASPGQRVTLHIQTKNHLNTPLAARVSVAVVDQGLLDIYDELKKPIENFYVTASSRYHILTNYKLLYKALKVFTADGTKGGAGGYNVLVQTRKRFLDVAYRSGAVMTDVKGMATVSFTLPDNTTTWVIDATAISQQLQMSNTRSSFQVAKKVMIEPNLPAFLTIHDRIQIPVRVTINDTSIQNTVLSGSMNIGISDYPLSFATVDGIWMTTLDMNRVPLSDILSGLSVQVTVSVGDGKKLVYDAVVYDIPLRTQGYHETSVSSRSTRFLNTTITLPPYKGVALAHVTLATLPVDAIQSAVQYLISYPYGCTEQLVSSMYPISVAQELQSKGLDIRIISGSSILIGNQYISYATIVRDTLSKLLLNQRPNGLFGYRPSDDTTGNPALSAYVYGLLKMIQKQGYQIDQGSLTQLEAALEKQSDSSIYLYYTLQKALQGLPVNIQTVQEKSLTSPLLGALIQLQLGKNVMRSVALITGHIGTQSSTFSSYDGVFLTNTTLTAYLIRGLVKQGDVSTAALYVQKLLNQRTKEGIRGRSTQETLQVLLALGEYTQKVYQPSSSIQSVRLNGRIFSGLNLQQSTIFPLVVTGSSVPLQVQSDIPLFINLHTEWIPQNPLSTGQYSSLQLQRPGRKIADLDRLSIGSIVPLTGQFVVEKAVRQFAVEYHIPSNFTFLNPLSRKGGQSYYYGCGGDMSDDTAGAFTFTTTIPTANGSWYSCRPTHFEVRFDKLFLYYDNLPVGADCTVTMRMMKTHDANTILMPSRLFEMYGHEVWSYQYFQ